MYKMQKSLVASKDLKKGLKLEMKQYPGDSQPQLHASFDCDENNASQVYDYASKNGKQTIVFCPSKTNSLHLISEQDNRGQLLIRDDSVKIPNPHFMTTDYNLITSGYGIDSYYNFFNYVLGIFPKNNLVSIKNYRYIAKVIDFVNQLIKKWKILITKI